MTVMSWLEVVGVIFFFAATLTVTVYSIQNSLLVPLYEELGDLCEKLSSDFRLPQKALALVIAMGEIVGEPSIGAKFTWATVKSRLSMTTKSVFENEVGPVIRTLTENTPKPLMVKVERAVQLCIMILIVRNPFLLAGIMWQARTIRKRQAPLALLRPITTGVGRFRADFERFVSPRVKGALAA